MLNAQTALERGKTFLKENATKEGVKTKRAAMSRLCESSRCE